MNKKGFTLIELLVSITLVSLIAYFLFQIIFIIRDIYIEKNIKSELYIETSNVANIINKDIANKLNDGINLKNANKVSDTKLDLIYSDMSVMEVNIDKENNKISYGTYSVDISKDAVIGNISLYYNYDLNELEKNGVFYVKIPITLEKYNDDFSVYIYSRYDSSYAIIGGELLELENTCNYDNGTVWAFDYTGDVQDFTIPCDGTYKVELWGAQGGSAKYSTQYNGGKGGYTKGNISLTQNQKIYLYVGGMGVSHSGTSSDTVTNNGNGYNGGGTGIFFSGNSNGGGGGGATDVRYFDGTPTDSDLAWNSNLGLNSRIMVSAGGGGGDSHYQSPSYSGPGGAGGGIIGYNGNGSTVCYSYGAYGTQIAGGYSVACDSSHGTASSEPYIGLFGVGGTSYHTGGGSGYYGGGSGHHTSAGGGSSYISGHAGCLAIDGASTSNPRALKNGCTSSSTSVECSTHYSGLKFTDTVMIDGAGYNWTTTKGSLVNMPTHDGTSTMTGNSGNGYAKITLVESTTSNAQKNTVTFETWDGTLDSYTREVTSGSAIGELPIPTLENATLEGWYLDSDYTTKIDETYVVTEDITLYAMYKYDLSKLSSVAWSTYHSGNAMERKEYDAASDSFVFYVGGSATGTTYYTHRFTTQLIPISSPCKINIAHSIYNSGNNYSPSGTVQIKDRAGNILYQTTSLGSATKDIEVPAGGFSIYANYYGPGNWFVSVTVNSILLK